MVEAPVERFGLTPMHQASFDHVVTGPGFIASSPFAFGLRPTAGNGGESATYIKISDVL